MELHIVLGRSLIAHLFVLEDVFDYMKGMFGLGAISCPELLLRQRKILLSAMCDLPDRLAPLGNPSHYLLFVVA